MIDEARPQFFPIDQFTWHTACGLAPSLASYFAAVDPLPPVVNGRFEETKIADFPKNEHWHWYAIEDSIAYDSYLRAE